MTDQIPLGRVADASEIASAIVFLLRMRDSISLVQPLMLMAAFGWDSL